MKKVTRKSSPTPKKPAKKKAKKQSLSRRVDNLEKLYKRLSIDLSQWYFKVDEAISKYEITRFEIDSAIEKRYNDLFNEILHHRRAVEKQINQKRK